MSSIKAALEKALKGPKKAAYLINYKEIIRAKRLLAYLFSKIHSLNSLSSENILEKVQKLNGLDLKNLNFADLKKTIIKGYKQLSFNTLEPIVFLSAEVLDKDLSNIFTGDLIKSETKRTFYLLAFSLKKNSSLYRQFKKTEALFDLEPLSREELFKWTARELQLVGLPIKSQEVISFLIDFSDADADKIYHCIRQLYCYTDGKPAELSHCKELFSLPLKETVWNLADLLVDQKLMKASALLSSLLEANNPFMILGALNYAFFVKTGSKVPVKIVKNRADNKIKRKNSAEAILRADSRLKHYSLGELNTLNLLLYELNREKL